MCGRFTQTKSREEVLEQLAEMELPPLFHGRYNVAPTQKVAVIRQQNPSKVEECSWGFENPRSGATINKAPTDPEGRGIDFLVGYKVATQRVGELHPPSINARSETLPELVNDNYKVTSTTITLTG
jgi:putative SOS response-associated peptidase YedK